MSAALVRQALEFVDPEQIKDQKKTRKRTAKQHSSGQVDKIKLKSKVLKNDKKFQSNITEENIAKLLALSKPAVDKETANKIITRARKGKPLVDKIEVKTEVQKSILFPDDEE